MGCSSEKSVPINIIEENQDLGNSELDFDLHDIEKQGEGKHPKIEDKNDEKIEKEIDDYYNYNLNDLISVNNSKMKVKRIENFDDDDSDDKSEISDENNKENNIDENKNNIKNEVNDNEENINNNENEENKEDIKIPNEDKKPEDKKPPNIQKLKKKGKEKIEINLFN